jgi:hypothetical protein
MNSYVTPSFIKAFRALPTDIQQRARQAYREWRENPAARHFKCVGDDVSVRIDRNYRALGIIQSDTVYWYWIGKHDDYDRRL